MSAYPDENTGDEMAADFWTHWYFHVPNFIMAALIYTLIGRYVLELLFAHKPDVVILRTFRGVTDPVVKLVRRITPRVVPDGLCIVFAMVWLMGLRMFLYLEFARRGVKLFTPA
jgi:uncharacterized protein YggT (Ycf19 family)